MSRKCKKGGLKRIWFTQQKLSEYMPLRAGLGLITEAEFQEWQNKKNENALTCVGDLCPKIYTTRTHPLSGKYVVVEGSRYKAKPVEPRIEFQVNISWLFDLKNRRFSASDGLNWATMGCLDQPAYSFAELDLGYKGADLQVLIVELMKLNKKAAVDTPFYINKLEPVQPVHGRVV